MNKWLLAAILILIVLIGYAATLNWASYPMEIIEYENAVNSYSNRVYLQTLTNLTSSGNNMMNFTGHGFNDSISGLNYTQLYYWINKFLVYAPDNVSFIRQNYPIQILFNVSTRIAPDNRLYGRCGEFSLLYNSLLLANGYNARLVVDCSYQNKSYLPAGDHMWNEILINGKWIPIDTTQPISCLGNFTQCSYSYKKTVNMVYATNGFTIWDVTKEYA
jgi:hypothetical protein